MWSIVDGEKSLRSELEHHAGVSGLPLLLTPQGRLQSGRGHCLKCVAKDSSVVGVPVTSDSYAKASEARAVAEQICSPSQL